MSLQSAQGLFQFLEDLVASGDANLVKIECGPFVEPLTPSDTQKLNGFRVTAVLHGHPTHDKRDTVLGVVHCVAYIPSRRA